ncbi:MAG TPA: DUF1329 domain-containing protein [Solimonas sp.]
MRNLRCLTIAILTIGLPTSAAFAQQYRSEVRELDNVPAQEAQQDPNRLLRETKDPYARALLLRDLAAQAAQKKDFAAATRYLEQALGQNALSGLAAEQMRKDLSSLYLASGDYKKILPQLEAQVKGGNASPELMVALGAAYLESGRHKDAVPLLQRAIAGRPKADVTWRRALASALMGSGREKEALPVLEQLLKDDPSQRDDWMRLVALNLKFGDRARAAALMDLASRLGFLESADERLQLANLTAQIGAPFEAASALQTWIERKQVPLNADTAKLRAALWLKARESGLAASALAEAIRLAPSAELLRQKAQLHMDREEYEQAAEALEAAIERGSRDGNTLMALGMARYQRADVEGALQAFREAGQGAATRKLAGEWVQYLETGKAREQALTAAAERRTREAEVVRLSGRITGGGVTLTAGAGDEPMAPTTFREALTPVGAESPGNRDGTIPSWEGGLSRAQWPATYQPGGPLVDPYPGDKPLFTISAANAAQYRDALSPGQMALLQNSPGFVMPVYPSRRSVAFPQAIYTATQANIGKAKLEGSDALVGARLGFPFPKPQSGVEIMWNHRTRYRGDTLSGNFRQVVLKSNGDALMNFEQQMRVLFRYGNVASPADLTKDNFIAYGTMSLSESGRGSDFVALFHETANSIQQPRNVWVLIVKLGRMLRIPPVGYDQPMPGADGLMFVDMLDMYNGAFDRYVWKLTGKRELYIPYNAFRLGAANDGKLPLKGANLDPALSRYERHRVWVIEATERGGKRHTFGKRTFYVDEDSWTVVLVENEDRNGKLWRIQEGHLVPLYHVQATLAMPVMLYDLKDGRRLLSNLPGLRQGLQVGQPMREAEFLPAAVKVRYSR